MLIMDLYGNLAYRFEQFDGSLSLPFKSNGRYHLAGNIVVCSNTIFKRMLDNTAGVFNAVKNSKLVVIPPLPRYLILGCCKQSGHSFNVNNVVLA